MIDFLNITGGGDGQWVWVENLNPEGDLSLRHALTRTDIEGPRNIGFKVSGDIFGSIDTSLSNYTMHGATSPGGICLRNAPDDMGDRLNNRGDNIILDNVRIRPGYTPNSNTSESRRALNFQGTKGAIVSNCSLTWAYDQIVSAWYGTEDILFSRNIIAEGLYDYGNGKYGMGALIGDAKGGTGGGDVYFYQNIFAHNKGRNPKINIAGIAYLWNNLIYNPGDWVIHLGDRFGLPRADVIGNVLIPGSQSNNNAKWPVRADGNAELFAYDNIGPCRRWSDWDDLAKGVIYDGENVDLILSPHQPDIPLEIVAAQHLEGHLLPVVGALPHDDADTNILYNIHHRTGSQIGNEAEVGGYPELVEPIPEPAKTFVIFRGVKLPPPPELVRARIIDRSLVETIDGDKIKIAYTCEVE